MVRWPARLGVRRLVGDQKLHAQAVTGANTSRNRPDLGLDYVLVSRNATSDSEAFRGCLCAGVGHVVIYLLSAYYVAAFDCYYYLLDNIFFTISR